jgi:hypothetical protein
VIYQCYFRAEHAPRLFSGEPYVGFGLEPDLNPHLLENCPELADPATRLALSEYAAFLNLWRRLSIDDDDWIGFTSYRQLDKSDLVFESKRQVERLLKRYDVLAWHVWLVGHLAFKGLTGPAAQAEHAHPDIHWFIRDLFAHVETPIPDGYFTADAVPYANYWVMSKARFRSFMEWSWPLVQHALALNHPYKRPGRPHADSGRAVGYVAERLFVIWVVSSSLRCRRLGTIQRAPALAGSPRDQSRNLA